MESDPIDPLIPRPRPEKRMHDETMSRRDFGRLLGAAAVSGALPALPAAAPVAPAAAATVQGAELTFMPASELASRLRRKDVSAREVLTAHIAQIERVN